MVVLGKSNNVQALNHRWGTRAATLKDIEDNPASARLAVSVEEAAALLSVSEHTIRRAITQRRIPSFRINRRVVVPLAALKGLLMAQMDDRDQPMEDAA
jgi:excisionase family DNA binding protein